MVKQRHTRTLLPTIHILLLWFPFGIWLPCFPLFFFLTSISHSKTICWNAMERAFLFFPTGFVSAFFFFFSIFLFVFCHIKMNTKTNKIFDAHNNQSMSWRKKIKFFYRCFLLLFVRLYFFPFGCSLHNLKTLLFPSAFSSSSSSSCVSGVAFYAIVCFFLFPFEMQLQ